jgi:hypothetical protein
MKRSIIEETERHYYSHVQSSHERDIVFMAGDMTSLKYSTTLGGDARTYSSLALALISVLFHGLLAI